MSCPVCYQPTPGPSDTCDGDWHDDLCPGGCGSRKRDYRPILREVPVGTIPGLDNGYLGVACEHRWHDVHPVEWCRRCRDLDVRTPAEFIVWGPLFPKEAQGPRCHAHLDRSIRLHHLEAYAVLDLRNLRRVPTG